MTLDLWNSILSGFSTGIGVIFANHVWDRYLKAHADKADLKRLIVPERKDGEGKL